MSLALSRKVYQLFVFVYFFCYLKNLNNVYYEKTSSSLSLSAVEQNRAHCEQERMTVRLLNNDVNEEKVSLYTQCVCGGSANGRDMYGGPALCYFVLFNRASESQVQTLYSPLYR